MKMTLVLAISFFVFSQNSLASFENLSVRFLSPLDVILKLKNRFPVSLDVEDVNSCKFISPGNINLLGGSSPLSGKPIQKSPQHLFISWYHTCLKFMSENYFSEIKQKKELSMLESFLPEEFIKKHKAFQAIKDLNWNQLSEKDVQSIIIFQLTKTIGPESVLADLGSTEGYLEKSQKMIKILDEKEEFLSVIRWISIATMMQTEALRY